MLCVSVTTQPGMAAAKSRGPCISFAALSSGTCFFQEQTTFYIKAIAVAFFTKSMVSLPGSLFPHLTNPSSKDLGKQKNALANMKIIVFTHPPFLENKSMHRYAF